VTAFTIQAASDKGIDYEKLIQKFGCYSVTSEMHAQLERIINQPIH